MLVDLRIPQTLHIQFRPVIIFQSPACPALFDPGPVNCTPAGFCFVFCFFFQAGCQGQYFRIWPQAFTGGVLFVIIQCTFVKCTSFGNIQWIQLVDYCILFNTMVVGRFSVGQYPDSNTLLFPAFPHVLLPWKFYNKQSINPVVCPNLCCH